MNFQIKLFSWPDRGNHIITIVRGLLEIDGCDEIFRKVGEIAVSEPDCKVLIDLADAKCNLQRAEVESFADGLEPGIWPRSGKVALVGTAETEQYAQLQMLSGCLSQHGIKIAAFYNAKTAVDWLAAKM